MLLGSLLRNANNGGGCLGESIAPLIMQYVIWDPSSQWHFRASVSVELGMVACSACSRILLLTRCWGCKHTLPSCIYVMFNFCGFYFEVGLV